MSNDELVSPRNSCLDQAMVVEERGVEIKDTYLTMGRYDLVCVIEGPDDETVAAALISLGSQGNVQTETLKAFDEDQYRKIVGSV